MNLFCIFIIFCTNILFNGWICAGNRVFYLDDLYSVNIFLDHVPGSRSYFLNTNPAGTVNVKVLRDADGTITGMDYMTEEEVNRVFGNLS